MIKKLLLSLTLILTASFAIGQELTKEQIKERKRQTKALMNLISDAEAQILDNPSGALSMLKPAIDGEHSALVANEPYLWYTVASAKIGVMQQEQLKQQEGQSFNQNLLYKYCYEVFQDLSLCDKLDKTPDAKGRVKPKYSEQIKKILYENRNNLFNGGAYFYNEGEFEMAFNQFDTFIKSATYPSLAEFGLAENEFNNIAAYYASLCGMRMENYEMVLTHIDIAVKDSANAESAYQFKADAQLNLGDTIAWINTLKECSVKYPTNAYFYQNLIQYYDNNNKRDELIQYADDMIAKDPQNPLFVYVKGYIAQQSNQQDEAIVWYKKTLEIDPNYENAIGNLALCYIQQAQEYSNEQASVKVTDKAKLKKDKEILSGYFKEALPLYEKLRQIAPDKTNLWLNGLYQCYYNLNMETELNEIEKLLPQE
ncbi:MAG: hypothetical protein IKL29_02080 [Bacteroidaceae bacterium]|nr:hypothetical protein [Bacteroidaceae bacterium]